MSKITTKQMAIAASMATFAIVLDYISFKTNESKYTLYGLPLMITGILFGPLVGALAGFVTGMIAQIIYGLSATAPLWMLAPIAWGFISGLLAKALKSEDFNPKKVIVTVFLTSAVATGLNTLAMWLDGLIMGYPTPYIITGLVARCGIAIAFGIFYCFVLIITLPRLRRYSTIKKNKPECK